MGWSSWWPWSDSISSPTACAPRWTLALAVGSGIRVDPDSCQMTFELRDVFGYHPKQKGLVEDGCLGDEPMPDNGRDLTITDYQDALTTLTREELERLHKALLERLQATLPSAPARRSLLDLEGLGAEVWGGLDAQAYVNHERDSGTS
jgi:hypothetical protein